MNAKLYVDKGEPFVSVGPETLSDGSIVWNIDFRGGQSFHPASEEKADAAFNLIAQGLKHATDEILVL